jgi:hypothetical protein
VAAIPHCQDYIPGKVILSILLQELLAGSFKSVADMTTPRRPARLSVLAVGLLSAGVTLWSQDRPLAVVSVAPNGEVASLAEAGEIRMTFSDPMVDLGGPVPTSPAWLSITPAIRANYYWSGTRTLIVTADPDTPLPFATRFTVRVDSAAKSASGSWARRKRAVPSGVSVRMR